MPEKDVDPIKDLEVEPLTDSDLESASGGLSDGTSTCPTTSGCPSTSGCPPIREVQG